MTADELPPRVISSALHPSSPGPPALPTAPSPVVTTAAPDLLRLFPFPLPMVVPDFPPAWEQRRQQQCPRPGLLLPGSLQAPPRQDGTLAQHQPGEVTQGFVVILPARGLVGWGTPTHAGCLPASCGSAVASAKLCHGQRFARRSRAGPLPAMPLPKANRAPVPLGEAPVPGRWWGAGVFPTRGQAAAVPASPSWGRAAGNLATFGSFCPSGSKSHLQRAYLPKSFPEPMPAALRQGMFGARSPYLESPRGLPVPKDGDNYLEPRLTPTRQIKFLVR